MPYPQNEGMFSSQIRTQSEQFDEQYGFHNIPKTDLNTDSRPSRVTLQPISEIKRIQTNQRGHSY